jgi:hypothetical protein
METQIKKTWPLLDSENGIMQLIMAVGVFLLMNLGVDEAAAVALLTGLLAMFGEVRGIIKKGLDFVWSWNSLVYLAAALAVGFPALSQYWDLLPDLGRAIAEQNWALLGTLLITLFNMILQSFRKDKSEEEKENLPRDVRGR